MKTTGMNRSLAHASGSVGIVRSSVGRRLAKILRSLKRQRESDFENQVSAYAESEAGSRRRRGFSGLGR